MHVPPIPSDDPQSLPLQFGWHTPPLHQVGHGWLQEPQCALDVPMSVSQPLAGLPSQLAQSPEHTGVHTPEMHDVVPCAFVHTVAHVPQLEVV